MNTVLIASYYFPPYADVSVFRSTKHCKYLPQFGWTPIVLTVDPKYYGNKIISVLPEELKKLEVVRIPYFQFPGNTVVVKLLFPFIIFFMSFIKRKTIKAVYMSGSPYHPFLMTTLITGLLNIPTVLDFRDAWSINHNFKGKAAHTWFDKIREKFFHKIEDIAICFSTSVIFSTPILRKEYEQIHPTFNFKFNVITNGYDPDDFKDIKPNRLYKNKTLIMTGKFYFYTPDVVEYLMHALQSLPTLCFVYVGDEHELIQKIAAKYRVSEQVTTLAYRPLNKILALVAGADFGLVTNGLKNGLGTKIFDYLALKKPTLCFIPQGSIINKYFNNTEAVVICEASHSRESVAAGLRSLLLKETALLDDISKFSRIDSAQKLALILDKITKE